MSLSHPPVQQQAASANIHSVCCGQTCGNACRFLWLLPRCCREARRRTVILLTNLWKWHSKLGLLYLFVGPFPWASAIVEIRMSLECTPSGVRRFRGQLKLLWPNKVMPLITGRSQSPHRFEPTCGRLLTLGRTATVTSTLWKGRFRPREDAGCC